jgi:hypothetical protein
MDGRGCFIKVGRVGEGVNGMRRGLVVIGMGRGL